MMMKAKVIPDDVTYGTLIDAAVRAEDDESAIIWHKEMLRNGIREDEITKSIMKKLYKKKAE